MRRVFFALLACLVATSAFAQNAGSFPIKAIDWSTLATTNVGDATNHAVRVACVTGCSGGAGGTSAVDNAAFTQSTTTETPIGGLASTNDAAYTSATTGHNTIWQLTLKGHGVVDIGNGGATDTEAATQSAGKTLNADVLSYNLAYNPANSNYARVIGRSTAPTSGDIGFVTHGFTGCDTSGNCQPAMDAAARAAFIIPTALNSSAVNAQDIVCDSTAKYDASSTGSTQLVAISGSTTIYVCGYEVMVGGTATNVKLVRGTGSNCGTGPADLTPAWQIAANGGKVSQWPTHGYLFKTAGSDALCVNASAANAVQLQVYYAQR